MPLGQRFTHLHDLLPLDGIQEAQQECDQGQAARHGKPEDCHAVGHALGDLTHDRAHALEATELQAPARDSSGTAGSELHQEGHHREHGSIGTHVVLILQHVTDLEAKLDGVDLESAHQHIGEHQHNQIGRQGDPAHEVAEGQSADVDGHSDEHSGHRLPDRSPGS